MTNKKAIIVIIITIFVVTMSLIRTQIESKDLRLIIGGINIALVITQCILLFKKYDD